MPGSFEQVRKDLRHCPRRTQRITSETDQGKTTVEAEELMKTGLCSRIGVERENGELDDQSNNWVPQESPDKHT
jgi:hypothetical protein